MSTAQSEASDGPTIPDALRQVADWLEQHPGEEVRWATIYLKAESREDLERIGAALGDQVTEELRHGDVEIARDFTGTGRFPNVTVNAALPVRKLRDAPPVPEYEPILGGRA